MFEPPADETVEERKARWRSVAVHGTPVKSKTVVHKTDTATVTETIRDDGNDVNVALNDATYITKRSTPA